MTVLPLPFQFGYVLFFFCLLWLGFPILCSIEVIRVGLLPIHFFTSYMTEKIQVIKIGASSICSYVHVHLLNYCKSFLIVLLIFIYHVESLLIWWWILCQKPFMFPIAFSSVQLLSRVQLFVTPWITVHQAYLSITIALVWY